MGSDVAEGHWVSSVGNRCAGPGRTVMCLQEGCTMSAHRDRGPELRGGVTLRAQGYRVAVSTAAGALAVRWAQVLEVTTTVGEVGTGLAQPKFTEGEGGPVTLRAGPVVQQVVSEAPSELCGLLTLADVGRVRLQKRQVRDTSSGGG